MKRVLLAAVVLFIGMGAVAPTPGSTAFEVHKVDQAALNLTGDKPIFVLVMGHDARPGDTQSRGDALHVIGINPAAGRATILNIPRDTWTDVPGHGIDKINTGHYYGGPTLEAKAVSELVGIDIPVVLSTSFQGLSDMVDELGGVDVNVPVAMNDSFSGAVFPAGPVKMDGGAALAFARNRHLAGNDFTRTQDQAILILAGLAKLRSADPSPANTLKWMSVMARHTTLDGIGLGDLYHLGRLALSLDPANIRTATMPGTPGEAANQSVVFVGAGAPALFADFRDDAILQQS